MQPQRDPGQLLALTRLSVTASTADSLIAGESAQRCQDVRDEAVRGRPTGPSYELPRACHCPSTT